MVAQAALANFAAAAAEAALAAAAARAADPQAASADASGSALDTAAGAVSQAAEATGGEPRAALVGTPVESEAVAGSPQADAGYQPSVGGAQHRHAVSLVCCNARAMSGTTVFSRLLPFYLIHVHFTRIFKCQPGGGESWIVGGCNYCSHGCRQGGPPRAILSRATLLVSSSRVLAKCVSAFPCAKSRPEVRGIAVEQTTQHSACITPCSKHSDVGMPQVRGRRGERLGARRGQGGRAAAACGRAPAPCAGRPGP